MLHLFHNIKKAVFISRPNRFVVQYELEGKTIRAFLPNPGRLRELFLPGVTLYLEKAESAGRKIPYTVVAVEKDGCPIMLHTHKTNDVAQFLIEQNAVPGLEGVRIIRREVKSGHSRFDFLLQKDYAEIFLEVKSCTLVSERATLFPDAVTARGKRHVEELARLSNDKTKGAVLFIIHWPKVEYFLPEYHTDLEFAQTLYSVRDKLQIIPLAVSWNHDLSLNSEVKLLKIPWEIVGREAKNQGSYLLILRLPADTDIQIGELGEISFRQGYYIYVGRARRNLSQRLERHRRLRKKMFWHIDYLRAVAELIAILPIHTVDDLECSLAKGLKEISQWEITGFGSSDCSCSAHLFGMAINPLDLETFHQFIQYYRIDRLLY